MRVSKPSRTMLWRSRLRCCENIRRAGRWKAKNRSGCKSMHGSRSCNRVEFQRGGRLAHVLLQYRDVCGYRQRRAKSISTSKLLHLRAPRARLRLRSRRSTTLALETMTTNLPAGAAGPDQDVSLAAPSNKHIRLPLRRARGTQRVTSGSTTRATHPRLKLGDRSVAASLETQIYGVCWSNTQ